MHILFLGINYWPEETGIAVFNTGRCEYLASQGHEVTICTAFPYYPQWQVPAPYRRKLFVRELHNGVTICRSYVYVPQRVTSSKRILHEASFIASSCLRALGGKKPDLLFVVSPPLGLGISAMLLSRVWRIPFLFHVEDLQPDAAVDLGMLHVGRLTKFLYGVERLAYRHAAVVSTITESMRLRIVAKGIPDHKVILSSAWADPTCFSVPLQSGGELFRRMFGFTNRFLVIHSGNMGVKQGLEMILHAASQSRDDDGIAYLLVGDGVMRPQLERQAQSLGLRNLHFLPLQPKAMFLDMLAAADVCLVTQQQTVADIVFPSKVVTLLSAGRPVVASLNSSSEVARVVTEAGSGVVTPPEDSLALRDALFALRQQPDRLREMSFNGRVYARERWNRERILPQMEAWLLKIAQNEPIKTPPAKVLEVGSARSPR